MTLRVPNNKGCVQSYHNERDKFLTIKTGFLLARHMRKVCDTFPLLTSLRSIGAAGKSPRSEKVPKSEFQMEATQASGKKSTRTK